MEITPDLSHLTEDERRIIEAVINRQKAEEKRDAQIFGRNEDFSSPPSINARRSSQQMVASSEMLNESGVRCEICQKTKFVGESTARKCSICSKRFCVRCGVRLKAPKSIKSFWLCRICREKQTRNFSSRKLLPTTSSVSQLTSNCPISSRADDENSSNISKQFVSDYILSQPFADGNDELFKRKRFLPKIDKVHSVRLENPVFGRNKTKKLEFLREIGFSIRTKILDEPSRKTIVEISHIFPGSIAERNGNLRIGDQILQWNGEKLSQIANEQIEQFLEEISRQTEQILLLVQKSNKEKENSTTNEIEKRSQIQLSFRHEIERGELEIFVVGAKNVNVEQNLIVCRVSIENGSDPTSKQEKTTKARNFVSNFCSWNQSLHFVDIETLDNLILSVKLIDLDRKEKTIGEFSAFLNEIDFTSPDLPLWFDLNGNQSRFSRCNSDSSENEQSGTSVNRVLPPTCGNDDLSQSAQTSIIENSSAASRKRQLPNIPTAQLHANREKVSQDLIQKATEIKLRLHMQNQYAQEKQKMYEDRMKIFNDEAHRSTKSPFPPQRASFQSSKSIDGDSSKVESIPISSKPYESMTNLCQKPVSNLKEKSCSKPKIPMIREKSAPSSTPYLNPSLTRRTTTAGQHRNEIEKAKIKTLEEKYKKSIRKRESSETPGEDVDSDGSELSTVSKISSVSMLSTQSERPRAPRKPFQHFHRHDEVQLNDEELRQMAMRSHETTNYSTQLPITKTDTSVLPSATTVSTTTVTPGSIPTSKLDVKNDGTLSDSVLTNQPESSKKRRPSMSSKALVILGLSKKTNSTSSLGQGKRFGFQRSEEIGVQPHLRSRTLQRQISKENETPSSAPATSSDTQSPIALSHQHHSMPHDMKLWSGGLKLPHEHQFAEFIEGLGSGQLVGRQVLASPCHGEIQVGLRDRHGFLDVEIVRARNLLQKALYKMPPAPYVKVYLLDGKTCIEKQRTRSSRRTLDPLIQQTLIFKENYRDKVLQIGVWGDYGKLDRKVFMGVCQINLEELRLSTGAQILDWFKLFSANSLMNNYVIVQQSPKRTISVTTNDSFSSFKSNSRLN